MAGFESTAHSVAWALYEIARHPEVQQKLADELAGAGLLWQPGGQEGREGGMGEGGQLCFCARSGPLLGRQPGVPA